tara:strand:- start:187 stop:783 length:597 start_codon:yes stop_codon:yes gene_type:complete
MDLNMIEIFPTSIYQFPNFIDEIERKCIFDRIFDNEEMHDDNHPMLMGKSFCSFRNRKKLNFLSNDIISRIEKHSNHYADKMGIPKVMLSSYWSIIETPGSLMKEHNHPNSSISGVIYVNVDQNSHPLVFKNPNPFIGNGYYTHQNKYNTSTHEVHPQNGDLILFPGWLEHGSDYIMNETDTRVSISFNLIRDYRDES